MQSSRGHRYILEMAEIEANYIDSKPIKNIMKGEMIRAHQVLFKQIVET